MHPIRAPHGLAPKRSREQRKQGEGGANRGRSFRGDAGQRMPPYEIPSLRNRNQRVAGHRQPGRGHMDEHDAHRLALPIVRRRPKRHNEPPPTKRMAVKAASQGSSLPLSRVNVDGFASVLTRQSPSRLRFKNSRHANSSQHSRPI